MMPNIGSIPTYIATPGAFRPISTPVRDEAPAGLPTESASISRAAYSAPTAPTAPTAAVPSTSTLGSLTRATTLALALALAGGLTGCASMAPGLQTTPSPVRQEQVQQQNPTFLNSVGSGAHKIADGFADFGKGVGRAAKGAWDQVSDGWKSSDQKPAAEQKPAPKAPVQTAHPKPVKKQAQQ